MGTSVTDERFWERLYPVMFPPERFERASTEIDQILALAAVKSGRALDMGCGPGRHAVALAKAGFEVTGVDLSSFLLAKAKDHATASGADVEWVREDMVSFVRPERYDLIVNLFTSFGYFKLQVEETQALRNMVDSLTEGGCIVMDLMGKEALAERMQLDRQPTEERRDALLIQRIDVLDDWGRARSEWILVRGSTAERFHFEHVLYSGQELRERLNWAGLSEVFLYGDFDGRPYGPGAKRLIAVGRR
jgi:SAM-dependent methyltransferase